MPVVNGVFTPLTLDAALNEIITDAPSSIVFSPGNPPELVLANMFAQASVNIDENDGEIMALFLSPVGSMIDLMNPNNPRKPAIAASGYVLVTNSTGIDVSIPPNTQFVASTGQVYSVGLTALTVQGSGTLDVLVTADETGLAGNIPSGIAFTVTGIDALTGINTLPFLSGAPAESDAIYLNRIIGERTEYGTQNGSVAVETEIKRYYPDATIYVNNTNAALTVPVPVPGDGYNLIVKTPSGILASAAEISQIFQTLSNRLEFVNSQNVGDALHVVLSGSVLNSGVPLSYYFTVAQAVDTTIDITINVRASRNATTDELITQANDFAVYFINRLMQLFSGIDGTTDIIYDDGVHAPVTTSIDIAGIQAQAGTIAPQFGVGTVEAFVSDLDTMSNTPNILFDNVDALTITIDPEVGGESPVVLSNAGGSSLTFIDFKNDALFSDSSSYYDRFMFIDPANISVTLQVVAWI
jgi:hypothetical protein